MSLKKYLKKRDFAKTSEPKSIIKANVKKTIQSKKSINSKTKLPIFVIHKHYATHLHYDFRLQMNNTLRSWAIPKTMPNSNEKRLAIQVEDHPLEYAKFKGIIPKGNYGAGKVEIYDKGTYNLIEKTKNKLMFKLNGKKFKGIYTLIKIIKTKFGKGNSWLMIKNKS